MDNTMLLVRNVEMYQWMEEFTFWKENGQYSMGERQYFYNKEWSSRINNSRGFNDRFLQAANPNEFPFFTAQFFNKVNLGQFTMSQD